MTQIRALPPDINGARITRPANRLDKATNPHLQQHAFEAWQQSIVGEATRS